FTPLLKKQSSLLETFEDLVKEFEAMFGDSEKSRTAANKIRKLVQGTRPASSYASEFRQIASVITDCLSIGKNAYETSQQNSINLRPLPAPAAVRGLWLDHTNSLPPANPLLNNHPVTALTSELHIYLSNGTQTSMQALVDSGASACFLDFSLAQELNLPILKKKSLLTVEIVDSWELSSESVIHETGPISVYLQEHYEEITFNLISSSYYKVILRLPWLTVHNPEINWHERTITFSNPTCKTHLFSSSETSITNKEQIFVVQVFPARTGSPYYTNERSPSVIPKKYQEYSDVFSEKEAYKLSKNCQYICEIKLLPNSQPPWGPIYELFIQELETLKKYIEENLEKDSSGMPTNKWLVCEIRKMRL
ncbi:9174_t:CDS:2, partial [Cetraspora pellucida]